VTSKNFLLATLLCLASRAPVAAQSAGDSMVSVFSVGSLKVIHQRRVTSQAVSAQLYLLGGARQIDARTAGIEPLVLRAAAFGSARYQGASSALALGKTGSSIAIDPENDWTIYSLRTIRQEFDSAWMVFADRVTDPTLEDADVVSARRLMLAEIVANNDNPDDLVRRASRPVGFANHPYANDPAGTDASVRGLRPQAVRDYHRNWFLASRMLLVVVGNVERATVEGLVKATLSALPAGNYVWALPPPVPRANLSLTIIPRETATDYIIGIFPGPVANAREYGAFRLSTGLLGAKLNYEIREKAHASYAAYAPLFDNAATAGGLYASTTRPEAVMQIMMEQIREVAERGLPSMWRPRFVSQFEIEDLLSRETCAGQAEALARALLIHGDVDAISAPYRSLRAVSEMSLKIVATRYFPAVQFVFIGDTSRFRQYMR